MSEIKMVRPAPAKKAQFAQYVAALDREEVISRDLVAPVTTHQATAQLLKGLEGSSQAGSADVNRRAKSLGLVACAENVSAGGAS